MERQFFCHLTHLSPLKRKTGTTCLSLSFLLSLFTYRQHQSSWAYLLSLPTKEATFKYFDTLFYFWLLCYIFRCIWWRSWYYILLFAFSLSVCQSYLEIGSETSFVCLQSQSEQVILSFSLLSPLLSIYCTFIPSLSLSLFLQISVCV